MICRKEVRQFRAKYKILDFMALEDLAHKEMVFSSNITTIKLERKKLTNAQHIYRELIKYSKTLLMAPTNASEITKLSKFLFENPKHIDDTLNNDYLVEKSLSNFNAMQRYFKEQNREFDKINKELSKTKVEYSSDVEIPGLIKIETYEESKAKVRAKQEVFSNVGNNIIGPIIVAPLGGTW